MSQPAVSHPEGESRNGHALHLGRMVFGPGTEIRKFVAIPEGATWAELRLVAGEHDTPRWVLNTKAGVSRGVYV